ncbi:MAG: DUF4390 domain-containing protein [bacterium]|nr:DUF4390 domain-containing protein [bacterium]
MISKLLKIFLTALLLIFISSTLSAQQRIIRIDSVKTNDGHLYAGFNVPEIFTDKVRESLNRGLNISISYQIMVWRSRNNWFDKTVRSTELYFKVGYDKINKRYIWLSLTEREQRATSSLDKVKNLCSVQQNVFIADTTQLRQNQTYYIDVRCVVEPLSVENFEEMSKWLGGEVEDINIEDLPSPLKSQQKITGRLLNLFKGIAGFSDIQYTGRSRDFNFTPTWKVQYYEH